MLVKKSAYLLCYTKTISVLNRNTAKMFLLKALALAISTTSFATAAVLSSSRTESKRSDGTVAGAEDGTSYYFNSTRTTDQCGGFTAEDVEAGLTQFDPLFLPQSVQNPFAEARPGEYMNSSANSTADITPAQLAKARQTLASGLFIKTQPLASRACSSHMQR